MSAIAYATMIDRTREQCYFLWDALKDALILELRDQNDGLFLEICNLSHRTPAKREMLTEALSEYGQAQPARARHILDRLVREEKHPDAALIAIQAAFELEQYDILSKMTQHSYGEVRKVAAQYVFYVWRKEPDEAFGILQTLADQVRARLVPNRKALDSAWAITFLILLDAYDREDTVEELRRTWVRILDQILYRDWDQVKILGPCVRWLREGIVGLAAPFVWRRIGGAWEDDPITTYQRRDLDRFFKQGQDARDRAGRLVPYVDIRTDLEGAWTDFQQVIQSDDFVSILLMTAILTAHGLQYDDPTISARTNPVIEYVKMLLDYALEQETSRPAIPFLLMALGALGRGYRAENVDDEYLALYEDCLRKYYARHNCVSKNTTAGGRELLVTGFGFYAQLYHIKDPKQSSRFLLDTVRVALDQTNIEFLKRYIVDAGGTSPGRTAMPALRALQPILAEMIPFA
jgi:hypothetical protein